MRKDSELFLKKVLEHKQATGRDTFELNIDYFKNIPNIDTNINDILIDLIKNGYFTNQSGLLDLDSSKERIKIVFNISNGGQVNYVRDNGKINSNINNENLSNINNNCLFKQRYYKDIINKVTGIKEGYTLFDNISLKDIYINTYLTKANINGERVQIDSELADNIIYKFVKSNYNVMIILGEPGQGKSTLSLMLSYYSLISNNANKIIYYFRLNNAISHICENHDKPKVDNAIYFSDIEYFNDEINNENIKLRMVKLLKKCPFFKNSIIIFDGYDELYGKFPSFYTYHNFFDDINDMAETLNSKIIVTSRVSCFKSLEKLNMEVDAIYYIDYLNIDQQIDWINNKYINFTKKNIIYNEKILKQINTEDTYRDLCKLMKITLLFQLIVDINILIDRNCNRAKLYKILFSEVIHKVYEKNKKIRRNNENNIDENKIRKCISELAYKIWCKNDEYIIQSDDEYNTFIENNALLFYFKTKIIPNNVYQVEFIHRSFY